MRERFAAGALMSDAEVTNVTVTADATYQCNLAWHFHIPTLACIFIATALELLLLEEYQKVE